MEIKSFKIDHRHLKPGIYLHDVKQFNKSLITTFDWRFKKPNRGDFLTNSEMHSLEHIIATFYAQYYPKDKIYFGPMGCQTGFYLVVYGKKDLTWLQKTLKELDKFINDPALQMPGNSPQGCGNYKTLSVLAARRTFNQWYRLRANWEKKYPK